MIYTDIRNIDNIEVMDSENKAKKQSSRNYSNNAVNTERFIVVNIAQQTLTLYSGEIEPNHVTMAGIAKLCNQGAIQLLRVFSVSTAKNGIGNIEGTGCTPLGWHTIAEKLGGQAPKNAVFVARMPTGEIYDESIGQDNPDRDWILSRILWLRGCEAGINLGINEIGCCDTYQRYIYIHGTPDTEPMGQALSHGCIRMRNDEIIWLFEHVVEGTPVYIVAS